ncbi:MAG: Type 1 glutamine amidotransferase-like domain-containing protein [Ktedonobacteraceae bacterium]|nr:Type 1 glutamine amidotransferase-like domain-containing protein [Ktedonobacteraceae bacterium]
MAGYILLEGGMEFGGAMAEPDRRALELAGGSDAPVCIIPTAAAPDQNHQRAGANGERWFRSLGATQVVVLPLLDRVSAEEPAIVTALSKSRLIYLLGGFTRYLGETLVHSASWRAMLGAYLSGAVIAGSSAGAMVLCQYYYDPAQKQVCEGLGLVPNACVLPHHNAFGKKWAPQLSSVLPDVVLIGIDEHTGMLDDGPAGKKTGWRVYGQGCVTLYRQDQQAIHRSGSVFTEAFA